MRAFQQVAMAGHIQRLRNSLNATPLVGRLASGAFWSLLGAVVSRGLQFLSCVVVARVLGTLGFGELGIIQSTLGMFAIVATFGLGLTAAKYIAEYKQSDVQKAGRIIVLSRVVATTTGVSAAIALYVGADR